VGGVPLQKQSGKAQRRKKGKAPHKRRVIDREKIPETSEENIKLLGGGGSGEKTVNQNRKRPITHPRSPNESGGSVRDRGDRPAGKGGTPQK